MLPYFVTMDTFLAQEILWRLKLNQMKKNCQTLKNLWAEQKK